MPGVDAVDVLYTRILGMSIMTLIESAATDDDHSIQALNTPCLTPEQLAARLRL